MTPTEDSYSLANLMQTVLDRVVLGFTEHGVELPDRRFWKVGSPVADCEQVCVYFTQAYVGPPGDEAQDPQRCNSPRTAQLGVQILRKVPTITGARGVLPAAEKIQAAAVPQAIDAWVLLDISCSLDSWEPEHLGAGLGIIATVDAGEAQGGFQGPVLNLTVAIP